MDDTVLLVLTVSQYKSGIKLQNKTHSHTGHYIDEIKQEGLKQFVA